MAIEIIPKSKIKKAPPINIAMYFLSAILLVFIIGYFFLNFNQKKLTGELADIENSLKRSPSEKNLEEGLFSYQRKIKDIEFLLGNHRFTVNFFDYLEKLAHPKVQFLGLSLDAENGVASIGCVADGFEVFGQQIIIFENEKFIKNVNLSGVSISKGGEINFNVQLALDPQIFTPSVPE